MKTTIDISDGLFREVKRYAGQRGSTFREVLESALRVLLKTKIRGARSFRLRKRSFGGKGLAEGLTEGNWSAIRERVYKGRGA